MNIQPITIEKTEVDIYDFDKTIFPHDSSSLFAIECFFKYPKTLKHLHKICYFGIKYILHKITLQELKRHVFSFIREIPLETAVEQFWNRHESKINKWCFKSYDRPKIIISASPEFLLTEISKKLKFDMLICTRHNRETGEIIGKNCHDIEKVRRFRELYPNAKVINVYSDSLKSDRPIFELGENRFLIVKRKPVKLEFSK